MLKENTFSFMIDESSKDFNGFDLKKQIFSGDFKTKKFEWDIAKEEEEKYFLKRGRYIMLTTSPLFLHLTKAQNYVENLLKESIKQFFIYFSLKRKPTVLVVGLGNRGIVSDSLGNYVTQKLLATKIVPDELKKGLGNLCYINAGVSAQTGVSSFLITKSVVENLKPDVVIVVDTLLTHSFQRLGTCFQLSSAGITPGAGVLNFQKSFDEKSLNCPVLSLGVPMLIPARDLGKCVDKKLQDKIFAPKEVDLYIEKCSSVISNAINMAVHKSVYKKYI